MPFAGGGLGDRRFLVADERGSIVAVANSSGAVTAVNTYDAYGKPGAGNLGRFQYTGQVWLEELGLYYYKARFYNPDLGRFMQTDPIGYGAAMNLYAYVGGDPVNGTDPTGLCEGSSSVYDNPLSAPAGGGAYVDCGGGDGCGAMGYGCAQYYLQYYGNHPNTGTTGTPGGQSGTGGNGGDGESGEVKIDCRKQSADETVVNAPAQLFNLEKQPDRTTQPAVSKSNSLIAEAFVFGQLTAAGKIPTPQVSFAYGGATSRIDFVTRQIVGALTIYDFIEVKFNSASLRPEQKIVFPGIKNGSAVPFGSRAVSAGLVPNLSLSFQLAENLQSAGPIPLIVRVCPVK